MYAKPPYNLGFTPDRHQKTCWCENWLDFTQAHQWSVDCSHTWHSAFISPLQHVTFMHSACCYCIPYQLVLMLVLTFAPSVLTFAPCAMTMASCACGVILPSTSASTPLAHMVVVDGCNLCWWCFSFSHWRKHTLHRWWCHPLQLALMVFFLPPTGAHTPPVLEQLALSGGGLWW